MRIRFHFKPMGLLLNFGTPEIQEGNINLPSFTIFLVYYEDGRWENPSKIRLVVLLHNFSENDFWYVNDI